MMYDIPTLAPTATPDAFTAEAIQDRLVRLLAEELDMDAHAIDVRRPLTQYGLDSMSAVILAGDMEEWLGVEVPSTAAWDHPTVADLSRFLVREVRARDGAEDRGPEPADASYALAA